MEYERGERDVVHVQTFDFEEQLRDLLSHLRFLVIFPTLMSIQQILLEGFSATTEEWMQLIPPLGIDMLTPIPSRTFSMNF
jgi:hypothetical protein